MLTSHQKARKSWWAGDSDTFCFRLQNFFNKLFQNGVGVHNYHHGHDWPLSWQGKTKSKKIIGGKLPPPPRGATTAPSHTLLLGVQYITFPPPVIPPTPSPSMDYIQSLQTRNFPPPHPPTEIVPYIVWAAAFIFRFIQQICFMKKWFEAWLTFMNNLGVFRIHKKLTLY